MRLLGVTCSENDVALLVESAIESDEREHARDDLISFVVIGYNEGATLGACIESIRNAEPVPGLSFEVIYVDGGSADDSIEKVRRVGVDQILGGEKRRRAAENRNLGAYAAQGKYIQFLDGDMTLASDWPKAAVDLLVERPEVAAVCGNLREAGDGVWLRALEIDWAPREGVIRHCGGAAMFRREPLIHFGGFPEDVKYGEEPLLCWRIRNELEMSIYQLNRTMANHDLGHTGFVDYWRRNVRVGRTYAEIAGRCVRSADRLWYRESIVNAGWAALIVAAAALLVVGPLWLELAILIGVFGIVGRKFFQARRRGYPAEVAAVYAVHTYLCKLPLAWGELRWLLDNWGHGKARS